MSLYLFIRRADRHEITKSQSHEITKSRNHKITKTTKSRFLSAHANFLGVRDFVIL